MTLYNALDVVQTILPGVRNSAQTGVGVDVHGFHSVLVEISAGVWTDGTHTFQVEDSDVLGSGYAAVVDALLQGTEPAVSGAGGASQIYRIGYLGTKRFVRVTTTESGTTGMAHAVNVIRGRPRKSI